MMFLIHYVFQENNIITIVVWSNQHCYSNYHYLGINVEE